jgi:site-specific DNA recombinase
VRAIVYARFSTDLQREDSIKDQVEVSRRFIVQQGWTLTGTYEDRAMSGASRFRPGYQQLLADVPLRRFDVVVVEALDRLGRKLADVADLHDRLSFAGIKLYAVTTGGEITPMHIGLLGTMSQLFLSDLREKTWRGQLGRALQGKIPGGKAYGYDVVADETGDRTINEAEAAIVRRIFREFADGRSPRAIAKRLNEEHVPGAGGRLWGDTTIRGQAERATGILNNALYVGRLEWNRCSYKKNPQTGKRVARPNPRDKWEVSEVPHLRLVDHALWQRVKTRQETVRIDMARDPDGNALNRVHRRQHLLSGLLECGCCGGRYIIIVPERYGCSTRRSKGTCDNRLMIGRQDIERRVLAGLKDRLMAPELVEAFVTEYQAEMRQAAAAAASQRSTLSRSRIDVDRKIAGIMLAIEDGNYNPALTRRLSELETEKEQIERRLAATDPPATIALHPNLPALYRSKVEHLETALGEPETRVEAAAVIGSLISKIVLTPNGDALEVRLSGDLAQMLGLGAALESKGPVSGETGPLLSVVAGTCNHLYRTVLLVKR